ncbi:MAG: hypothetical protein J2P17_26280, partial [Mycobacterium sp.]|nr:hypothetical protein [Mycobacterium sp.]
GPKLPAVSVPASAVRHTAVAIGVHEPPAPTLLLAIPFTRSLVAALTWLSSMGVAEPAGAPIEVRTGQ